jgi:hypothetical protein
MTKTNLKEIEKIANKFENNVDLISKEIKRVQSIKCRLKKQKGKKSYEQEMTETLRYEEVLKEAKQLLDPKEKPVTMYTQEDVDKLDYDETIKAIRSIQSKKTLSKYFHSFETLEKHLNDLKLFAKRVAQMKNVYKTQEDFV